MEYAAEQERQSWDSACLKCDPHNRIPVCTSHFSQLYTSWLRGDLTEIDGREIVTLSPTQRPL